MKTTLFLKSMVTFLSVYLKSVFNLSSTFVLVACHSDKLSIYSGNVLSTVSQIITIMVQNLKFPKTGTEACVFHHFHEVEECSILKTINIFL